MKQPILLRRFEYVVPESALALTGTNNHRAAISYPSLLKVYIDFENGELKLEGNWQIIMVSNTYNEAKETGGWQEKVKIKMNIYPALPIDLTDTESDGLVFPLEGSISNGDIFCSCAGLLAIDRINGQWHISIYLYDARFVEHEIKFKFPLYQIFVNENNN